MNLWTQESVRAENEYRRQQLHKLASHRRVAGEHRTGGWHRWVPRGLRH
jgi:hypothetical protein